MPSWRLTNIGRRTLQKEFLRASLFWNVTCNVRPRGNDAAWKMEIEMFKSFTGFALIIALTAGLMTVPGVQSTAYAQGNPNANPLIVPVTGAVAGIGTIAGNLAISRFAIQNGQLVAIGALTTTLTNLLGNVVSTTVSQVSIPVTSATGTCDILNLVLGPLSLNLLGLQVDLNQVVLDITAQAGAGNLLGNLLCAVAGLLDGGNLGQPLVGLLNRLISVLGAL